MNIKDRPKQYKKKINNNLGFYIPYSINNPDSSYEYLDELSFMVKNVDRSSTSGYNVFRWKNILNNKIENLMYIYIHIFSIPLYPWIDKNVTTEVDQSIIDYLLINKDNIKIDQNIDFNSVKTVSISYIGSNYIDFIIDYDYSSVFSLELYLESQKVFKYTRSPNCIINEPFLYVDIDPNDNLNNNIQLDTSLKKKRFTFKIVPITYSDTYAYYKGLGQHLLRTLNELITLDSIDVIIYSAPFKVLSNTHINKDLSKQISENKIINCDCLNNYDPDNSDNFKQKPSCYCVYLRHPLNKNNQIDISFKIGQIKNEQINNIFH